jgi:hypothetical protein
MAKRKERALAVEMRLAGKSYSEIKERLGVSKSTLSLWLREHPLSEEQMKNLRDWNPRRIENYKKTCQIRRARILQGVYEEVKKDIGTLTKRELFIAGIFLYWAEGTKTSNATVAVSNTDPIMLKTFLVWLEQMGIKKSELKVYLHLYSDMDVQKELLFWSKILHIPLAQFRKPYVKTSKYVDITYRKGGFGHGTCNIIVYNRTLCDYTLKGIDYIKEMFEPKR